MPVVLMHQDIYDECHEDGKDDPPYNALRPCLRAGSPSTGHSNTPIVTPETGIGRRVSFRVFAWTKRVRWNAVLGARTAASTHIANKNKSQSGHTGCI